MTSHTGNNLSKATFAAGCFWGVEAHFMRVEGVKGTTVGYTGGTLVDPTYKQVCSGGTGHAEAIEFFFDPNEVHYDQLLDLFWTIHNPTTRNRQKLDVGTQYRSAVFFHSPEQETAALASKERAQGRHRWRRIVTEITPATVFYPAEDYHQQYLDKLRTPRRKAAL